MGFPLRRAAPLIDAACLALFVLVGRSSHDVNEGASWFWRVLWPLGLGWFVVALAVRLYSGRRHPWPRLVVTWLAGVAVALAARNVLLDRELVGVFALVLYAFVGVTTFGWRAVAVAVTALAHRRDAPVDRDDRAGEVRAGA
jgi:hypothetical protein